MLQINDMSERELIIHLVDETQHIKETLDGHLEYHREQNSNYWKLFIGLVLTTMTAVSGLIIAIVN